MELVRSGAETESRRESGFGVQDVEIRLEGVGFGAQGLGLRFEGSFFMHVRV